MQYRIPKPIADIASRVSYESELLTTSALDVPARGCITWVDVTGEEFRLDNSKANMEEVYDIEQILDHITGKIATEMITHDVVITGYRSQKVCIHSRLGKLISVATVDSFQGRESPIVILSLVGTKFVGFLEDKRRTNVAITRVKEKTKRNIMSSRPGLIFRDFTTPTDIESTETPSRTKRGSD
jgi:superfamily I DNA and/or RNA helicase